MPKQTDTPTTEEQKSNVTTEEFHEMMMEAKERHERQKKLRRQFRMRNKATELLNEESDNE